jgi:hypothetical protein
MASRASGTHPITEVTLDAVEWSFALAALPERQHDWTYESNAQFSAPPLRPDEVGRTFSMANEDPAALAAMADRLTNGEPDALYGGVMLRFSTDNPDAHFLIPAILYTGTEDDRLFDFSGQPDPKTDLAGAHIDDIRFTFSELTGSLVPDGNNVLYEDVVVSFGVEVMGQIVPEPAHVALAFGLVALLLAGRARHPRPSRPASNT